jgi:hypothetical protein
VDRFAEDRVEPDLELVAWIRRHWLEEGGAFFNEDHAHLLPASIGAVWTNVSHRSRQLWVLAEARQPSVQTGPWGRARHDQQLREWFGEVPDFLLTFYAPTLGTLGGREFCAIVEHELYHCAQATTDLGAPRFHRDSGLPIYAIRGHDVEEFVGVVRRWGASKPVRDLVAAAASAPTIEDPAIVGACGTCAAPLAG